MLVVHRRALLTATLLLGLSACAGFSTWGDKNWPPGLPPIAFFEAAYAQDLDNHEYQPLEKYLYWVRSFYRGTALYPRGWTAISRDVLAAIPDDVQRVRVADALYTTGRDIAAEWSKSNRVSLVKSGHLAVWGVAAERAVGEGNIEEILVSIAADVQALTSERLAPGAIKASRYHEQDPDDIFAF